MVTYFKEKKQTKNMNVKALKNKVDELKALFILGARVVPFMEELFLFIEETTPLLDNINSAIKENLSKMPNASKQLTKVTQATEMASTEIMDTVDRVNDELYKIIDELEEFKNNQEQLCNNPITLLEKLATAIDEGKDLSPYLKDIRQFIECATDIRDNEHTVIIATIIDKVRHISDDANTIINSLQVQDITAQQLAAVNHLLENIQSRLTGIMKHINTEELGANVNANISSHFDESIKISNLHRTIAFDPDAVDSITAEDRQYDIDAMFANPDATMIELADDSGKSVESSDDIINSFNNIQQATESAENNEDDFGEDFSQEDIDAMFKNN